MPKRELRNCTLCGSQYLSWRFTQTFCSKSCAQTGKNGNSYKHGNASKHGYSPTYSSWLAVKSRIRHPHYKTYVGMYMDKEWLDFNKFCEDMGERPSLDYSIDRIDNSKGYYKENCRWATRKEQMNNTSSNKKITYNGKTMTQEQWGDYIGLNGTIICKRLKRGWSIEKSLTTPKLR